MKVLKSIIAALAAGAISGGAMAGQAVLAWNASATDPAQVTGYKVYRGTVSGTYVLTQTLGKVLTATETGLTAGTKYYWVVTAYNPAGESGYSNEASAIIPFVLPVPATGLTVTVTP